MGDERVVGLMDAAELRTHSAFSFGDGAVTPEALVARAAELGYQSLGITDTADLGGSVRFLLACEQHRVRPIVGAEFMVNGHPLALLARNRQGYRHIAALVTRSRVGALHSEWVPGRSGKPRGRPRLAWADVAECSDGVQLLTGPPSGTLGMLLRGGHRTVAERQLAEWREVFGARLVVEVQWHCAGTDDAALAGALIALAEQVQVPWIVAQDTRYLDDESRLLHELFTALRCGTDVNTAAERGSLLPNGQWSLLPPRVLAARWRGREIGLETTMRVAEECTFELEWMRPPLPLFLIDGIPTGDDNAVLREKTYAGAVERWGALTAAHSTQLDHELGMITRLGFAGFFLIMWEAVSFAQRRNILCQGRGSAANSAVAYCLGITAVDPIANGLLFERFLSEARVNGRSEAPDIDVDIEHDRREEVLDHMYERYGRGQAAITAVTQMYSACTALQDAMRALGYPAELAFALSKRLRRHDCAEGADVVEGGLGAKHGLVCDDARGRAVLTAMRACQDLPRLRSTHPGGFVLARDPLGSYLPIEETTRGRTIVQFDKDDLDIIGVPKFDFLGLGALAQIRRAFDMIEADTGTRPSIYKLPPDDRRAYDIISRGETVGMFQIESRAQIASLVHTRPERLYDLVVQVALIRPGPIQAKFVHPYTKRRRGLEEVTYSDPRLRPILERTCGIPIFQEQAMRIAMDLAGYSASEADALRRSMGHRKKAKRLAVQLEMLRANLVTHGLDEASAARIAEDLQSFANYGFPESHAHSFALIAYATAWLKAHHPTAFYGGLLNAFPMGFYSPATLMHDAKRHGVEIRPPCLRDGGADCSTEPTTVRGRPALRVGWRFIRGMGDVGLTNLKAARAAGPFTDIADVVRRADLSRSDTLALARAGAFGVWESERRAAAWIALGIVGDRLPLAPARTTVAPTRPLSRRAQVFLDYFATGMCLDGHPMEFLRARLAERGVHDSRSFLLLRGGEAIAVAGLVIVRQRPESAKGTHFVLLEDEHGFINVIVPKDVVAVHSETVRFGAFLLIKGRFQRDGPEVNVIAERLQVLRVSGLVYSSHDFR